MIRNHRFFVEAIVGDKVGDDGQPRYLIKWAGYRTSGMTWEPAKNIPSNMIAEWNSDKAQLDAMDVDDSDSDSEDDSQSVQQHVRDIDFIDLTADTDDEGEDLRSEFSDDSIDQDDEALYVTSHEALRIVGESRSQGLYEIEWRSDPATGEKEHGPGTRDSRLIRLLRKLGRHSNPEVGNRYRTSSTSS